MNSLNSTISTHQKGQHLALQDRVIIQVLRSQGLEHWHEVFKTITTDNGSEFADLAQLEEAAQTLVSTTRTLILLVRRAGLSGTTG